MKFNYYLPYNLDIDTLVYNKKPVFQPFKNEKLIHILSLINHLRVSNKDLLFNSFTPLNSTLLQKTVSNYKEYLDYLLNVLKIIETDNRYKKGEKSKGYRFIEKYQTMVKPYKVSGWVLKKNLIINKNKALLTTKKLNYLTKYFNSNLKINFSKCYEYLKEEYSIKLLNPELRDYDFAKEKYKIPINQFNRSLIAVSNIDNGCFYLKRDSNVNRFHSNLTNLNSVLRNAVSYQGKNLISIDITNSQPYLSTILFRKEFWSKEFKNQCKMNIYNFNKEYINYYIMLGENLENLNTKGFMKYINLVRKGEIYEYLQSRFQDGLGIEYSERKQIKTAVFQTLFTANTFIGQAKALPKKMFATIFPEVYNVFKKIKRKDKSILPRLLQSIESLLVIDIICKRISKEFPKAPIFTIHDSIATTSEFIDDVKRIILEECNLNVGFEPKLKIEHWNVNNIDKELKRLKSKVAIELAA